MHRTTTSSALSNLFMTGDSRERRPRKAKPSAERLRNSSESVSRIAIIDVHRGHLRETLQGRVRLARRLLSYTQIIPQREGTFWIEVGGAKRALVPDGGNTGLAFFHEGKAQQRAALHDVRERPAALGGLGDFLKFADGFFQQAHFAEGGAPVVMRLEIFLFGAHFAEFSAKLVDAFLQRTRFDCAARRSRSRRVAG